MTSSVIYYSTDARKNEIYLLNIYNNISGDKENVSRFCPLPEMLFRNALKRVRACVAPLTTDSPASRLLHSLYNIILYKECNKCDVGLPVR